MSEKLPRPESAPAADPYQALETFIGEGVWSPETEERFSALFESHEQDLYMIYLTYKESGLADELPEHERRLYDWLANAIEPFETEKTSSIEAEKRRDYEKEVIGPVEALKENFEVQTIGEVSYEAERYPLFLISTRVKNTELPNAFITAGVHGSEPAGVYAALSFLKQHGAAYQDKMNLFVIPCVNPSGFESGTRKNLASTDINRDFVSVSPAQETQVIKKTLEDLGQTYSFSLDMHEDSIDDADPEDPPDYAPKQSYLYESTATRESSIGPALVASLEKEGVDFCKASEIYEQENEGGVLWTPSHGEHLEEEHNTLEDYLQKYAPHTFTVETPAELSLQERVDIQTKMLRGVIDMLSGNGK